MNPEVMNDLRDVKGPMMYPENPLVGMLLWAGGMLCLCFLIYLFMRHKMKNNTVRAKKPWDIAIVCLNALIAKQYLEAGQFHVFYAELSDILRNYIELRFSIKAPEMTTEEFLYSLQNMVILSKEQKVMLAHFLQAADMVKFAKYAPTVEEARQGYELAKVFIEETREEEEAEDGV